jgi:hypothetical protein
MATRFVPLGDLFINAEHISAIRAEMDGERVVRVTVFMMGGATFDFDGEDAQKAFALLKSYLS